VSLTTLGLTLYLLPALLTLVGYVGYPLLLAVLRRRGFAVVSSDPPEWPEITVVLPVYNEARSIRRTLENLLRTEYPTDRRHVLVVSDASSDETDEIVQSFENQGIRLVRLPSRGGKTAAENAAGPHLRGSIVVNLDATIRVPRDSIKALVRAFQDPTVGVASGRDVSVGAEELEQNRDESKYVGYEMWVRRLETESGSIVGASGCLYAIRRELFDNIFPEALSRDFASPLIAREQGFRSVSVDAAVCLVPRTRSLKSEFRRKVRTMTRGLETLWYKRHLLNPVRYGRFALFLAGHKLVRWLVFPALPLAAVGLVILTVTWSGGPILLAINAGLLGLSALGYYRTRGGRGARLLLLAGFVGSTHWAGVVAWYRALRGELNPIWEPTRRGDDSGRQDAS
jgi:cellulose synthase/poly-beta-1,6-N-acetylglucosamine synthase-like glycosyltransferase